MKRSLTVFIVGALLVAACANKKPGYREFKLGLIPGAQEFIDFVMENHGLLEQVGLKADKVKSLSPANLHLMVAEEKVDIGFGGFTTMATARSQGKSVIVIGGVFSPVNMVFVRKNSPIHSLKDLKGKKLGVFGGPGSTTFTFLAVLAQKWNGIDLAKVRDYLAGLEGVAEVHDLHIWAMSTNETALTAHLVRPGGSGDAFLHQVCAELSHRFNIHHATLQVEASGDACKLAPAEMV